MGLENLIVIENLASGIGFLDFFFKTWDLDLGSGFWDRDLDFAFKILDRDWDSGFIHTKSGVCSNQGSAPGF